MDKQQEIVRMFDDIAPSYDLANRVLSLGIDVRWRKEGCLKALQRFPSSQALKIADIACGTGDMILHWQNYAPRGSEFIGIDPSGEMLEIAKTKLKHTTFLQAQAQKIPLDDESVDIVSIAYGLRNVCEYEEALREFFRILKKGGVLLILEFMHNPSPTLLQKGAKFYTQKILPLIGGMISKNYQAYRYLPHSIEAFISAEALEEKLGAFGFSQVWSKSYSAKLSTLLLASKQ